MGLIGITSTALPDRKFESVTEKVTVYSPEMVGMPVRVPSDAR
jgi:hypothetical protein